MVLRDVCQHLQDLGFATTIRESASLFPVIETVHVLALVLVIGSITRVDLRLIGLAYTRRSVVRVAAEALPWTWSAFAVTSVAGLLMFSSKAVTYYDNWPFRIKMMCLVLAGLNMLWFNLLVFRENETWHNARTPMAARVAGAISLTLWISVAAAGRWIGFTAA